MTDYLPAVKAYLGDSSSWTDETLEAAIAAEFDAQTNVCRVPVLAVDYPVALLEALCRRVARNLAMRGLPLGVQSAMSEAAVATIRIGSDTEVRRLEAPYRRLAVG